LKDARGESVVPFAEDAAEHFAALLKRAVHESDERRHVVDVQIRRRAWAQRQEDRFDLRSRPEGGGWQDGVRDDFGQRLGNDRGWSVRLGAWGRGQPLAHLTLNRGGKAFKAHRSVQKVH